MKPPTTFQPKNKAEELSKWMDWRFEFETFVSAVHEDCKETGLDS